ncbi:MAG: hypothetical protein A3G24_24085 [Betaproteobacteria bacterium RIFCSPLOWO2_12_FULL_62_13]|nr:MAG: hypothetical protein A3G24_24085 [Betaproteobacteria bacterium RIFCSPLOWO2_12_FULL_62_13]
MRAALFGPVDESHEATGQLAETAVFSQWMHNTAYLDSLHYARTQEMMTRRVRRVVTNISVSMQIPRRRKSRGHTRFSTKSDQFI